MQGQADGYSAAGRMPVRGMRAGPAWSFHVRAHLGMRSAGMEKENREEWAMSQNGGRLFFASDYMEGAHPDILKRLMDTNMEKSAGYGLDEYTESAKDKIREACGAPGAEV